MVPANLCRLLVAVLFLLALGACNEPPHSPSPALIKTLNLKTGPLISCGPSQSQFGSLSFDLTGSCFLQEEFNLGLKLLHSFEYDEAEKVFAGIIAKEPDAVMAYWGIAMSNFHPLWTPPSPAELTKGATAITIAKSLPMPSKKEAAYLDAIAAFYTDWATTTHRTRCLRFEQSMKQLHETYPRDIEATILYALALDAAADPGDKTYQKQQAAGRLLKALYSQYPDHPGIVHYLIHTYDAPELAGQALTAARRYAAVAPSSAHALHMPSHIFTRLGLWQECIQSNLASMASAQCYAEAAGIKGHWDEELHGMDYLVYAYLQMGNNQKAGEQLQYLAAIKEIHPANFKVAYAFAAIPARIVLENKNWQQAAVLQAPAANFAWPDFPWQHAILHLARALGAAHTGNYQAAASETGLLQNNYDTLVAQKDNYKANQVLIQIMSARAWLQWKKGNKDSSLLLMTQAAAMEDKTEKHPVTPAEVLPARELLGDLLMEWNEPVKALAAYEASLQKHPNRFNGIYGAALAAEKAGDGTKARNYYRQLLLVSNAANSPRPELVAAKHYLQ